MDSAGKYVGLTVGAVATLTYIAEARRRIRSGRGNGVYDRRWVGVVGLLILVVVAGLVGLGRVS